MTGFATVIANVRDDLARGTEYDGRIRRALSAAVGFYRSKRLPFNQRRLASGVTSSTEFLSLDPSYMQIDSIRMSDGGGGYYPLRKTNWGEIESRATSPTVTGIPVVYAVQARQIRFYPIPSQSLSFDMTVVQDLWGSTSLSDSHSDAWTNEGEELIRLHAMVEILQVYRNSPEDSQKAVELQNREALVYQELRRRESEEAASGFIQPFM